VIAFKLAVAITSADSLLFEFAKCTVVTVIEFMHLLRAYCGGQRKEKNLTSLVDQLNMLLDMPKLCVHVFPW
jgi:hypothetical protein